MCMKNYLVQAYVFEDKSVFQNFVIDVLKAI